MPILAFLDANVLYRAALRDLFVHLAIAKAFQPKWSVQIQDEWIDSLRRNRPDLLRSNLERTRRLMDIAAPDAMVTGHLHLIPTLHLPDPNDRHVLAAAIHSGATILVTQNLRDFPSAALEPFGIAPMHPDDFILRLIAVRPESVLEAVEAHRLSLKNPAMDLERYLAMLASQGLPGTVAALTELVR